MGWKLAKIVRNDNYTIDGVNIFGLTWQRDGQIELKDVAHAMKRPFNICSVVLNGKRFDFAVCEIAQGVFNFYLPDGQ